MGGRETSRMLGHLTMDSSRALRLLTIGFLVSVVLTSATSSFANDLLPPGLVAWKQTLFRSMPRSQAFALLGLGLVSIGLLIAGVIGLLLGRRWGAWAFSTANLAGTAVALGFGPSIQHPIGVCVDTISTLLAGAVLGVAFFSDALSPKQQDDARNRPA